jgi:hypothetical protein
MRPSEMTGRHRSRRSGLPSLGLMVLLAAGLAIALAVPSTGGSPRPAAPATALPAVTTPAPDWPAVVRELMRRRGEAYARSRPAALARVHRAGSPALAADRALLRSWRARGLHVDDAVVRVGAVRRLDRSPGRVELRVVHRLGTAVAVGPHGDRRALPRDRPQAHRVVLVRTGAGWRIAAVSG